MKRRQFLHRTSVLAAASLVPLPGWTGATESHSSFDLAPSQEYPRLSEGAFVTLKSGKILFVYTRFRGGASDRSPADLAAMVSADGGRTWATDSRRLVDDAAAENVMSVSLLRLRSGRIALFYLIKNSLLDCRPVVRFSDDEAETWSRPIVVTRAAGYFVLNNDRVIQLTGGRLLVPLAFHRSRGDDPKSYQQWDSRAIAMWYWSDDEGQTWHEASDWWALPLRSGSGFQEPGVVELADGRVFTWARTDQGAQFGGYSTDAGAHWTMLERTELASPNSPASIKRIPGSADLLALFNDHSGRFPFPKGKRTPLVAAISNDGGKTWPQRKLIESDPDGWYCYTAIHFTGESMLLAYCAGDSKVGSLNRTRLRRVPLDWLRTE